MELKEAKNILKSFVNLEEDIELKQAIETVLAELDTRYNKGYQDGFKQAKFDCEMDKLDGREK